MVYVWRGHADDVEECDCKANIVSDEVESRQCLDTASVNL